MMERRRALMGAVKGSGYAHGTWEDLFWHITKGDYASAYSQGETIPLDLGSTFGTINMEISNFNYDVLAADTSQKAPVTLIAKELLSQTIRWNPALSGSESPYVEGTGTIGGWEKSELRSWLRGTVLPAIPDLIRQRIANVAKYSYSFDENGVAISNKNTTESIFIPSLRETGRAHDSNGRASIYTALNSDAKRIKHTNASTSAVRWWTRSAVSTATAGLISTAGKNNTAGAIAVYNKSGICICFCLT